ncbi:hypothetical protein ANN_26553, partial [Periplaneta americana]
MFLPANSTHLTQPLDVVFFRALKMAWRKILSAWKTGPGRRESSVPKTVFPHLLKSLMIAVRENEKKNVLSGFFKCGIVPLNKDKVLSQLPHDSEDVDNSNEVVQDSVLEILKSLRYDSLPKPRQQRKKMKIMPGQSVTGADFSEESEDDSDPVIAADSSSDNEEFTNEDTIVADVNMQETKKKSKHFISVEKEVLKEIILKYSTIIENKKTDAVSSRQKYECWMNITEEFNSSIHIVEH